MEFPNILDLSILQFSISVIYNQITEIIQEGKEINLLIEICSLKTVNLLFSVCSRPGNPREEYLSLVLFLT